MAYAFSVHKYPGGAGAEPPLLATLAPKGPGAAHFISSVQIAVLYSAAFGEQVGMN